ncbi:MAG: serpin family protein [Planctomycetia bacterium]|nr:serpin family protein [Planctomycetia bacterium]
MHQSSLTRRRFLGFTGALAAGGLLASRASACPAIDYSSSVPVADGIAGAINQFAADLHERLSRDTKDSMFFSPFSIEAALAMTAAGARGETLSEMEKTLHLPTNPHAGFGELIDRLNGSGLHAKRCRRPYELSVANAIWAQKDFAWHKEFMELTRKHYGAGMVETDFYKPEAARKQINDWVEEQTRKKIKDLIAKDALNPRTRMVLTNAIYFKGDWQTKFDPKLTENAPFIRADGTKTDVPLMNITSKFNYGEFDMPARVHDPVQVLEMPYAGGELSMLIYLPKAANGINRLTRWLSADKLGKPELREQKVVVSLPKFKVESGFALKPPLIDLGMKKAFNAGDADFTGMSPNGKDLYITAVVHKAFVDVNEEGSEAAAATGVIIGELVRAPEPPPVFRADRPFVFTIRENETGAVLFLGRYLGK